MNTQSDRVIRATFIVCNQNSYQIVVSCVVPVGTASWMLFQKGQSSNLRLRQGVGQVAHTHNNPQVRFTGVYCAQTVNNAVTSELYGFKSRMWVCSLPLTLSDRTDSFNIDF